MHVRISKLGREILNDRILARKVIKAIRDNSGKMMLGEPFKVEGYKIQIATAIKPAK